MTPPPSTTASTGTGGTKKKKKKSGTKKKKGLILGGGSGGGIKIKPFARPPSLPANFYETSVDTLLRALGCVLREESLYVDAEGGQQQQQPQRQRPCASPKSAADPAAAGGSPATVGPAGITETGGAAPMDLDDAAAAAADISNNHKQRRRPMSREELYRLVEDLVTHNYGPQLYDAVLRAMDEAARTCLRRMVGVAPGCVEVETTVRFVPDGGAASSSTSGGATDSSGIGTDGNATTSDAILAQIHSVCASYYEYLRCVRSVFLHLDRRFLYLPGGASGGVWKR